MKTTDKQKKIIEFIKTQLSYWENTNDINSPTHHGDIEEELNKLEDILSINDKMCVGMVTHQLYNNIRDLDKDGNN